MSLEIQALEQQLAACHEAVMWRDKAIKLQEVAEFRDVVLQKFCVTDCARYAQSSADMSLDTQARADSLALAQAAGHLRRYLSVLVQMGNNAANMIDGIEAEIDAIRAEGEEA